MGEGDGEGMVNGEREKEKKKRRFGGWSVVNHDNNKISCMYSTFRETINIWPLN